MNRIKEVLERKGIKQTWLAEKLGKSYNMINSYVQNRRQPSLQDLFSIAKILDVSVSELIWKEEKKTSPSQEVSNYIVQEDNEQYATSESTIDIPLIGMVACGTPIFADNAMKNDAANIYTYILFHDFTYLELSFLSADFDLIILSVDSINSPQVLSS